MKEGGNKIPKKENLPNIVKENIHKRTIVSRELSKKRTIVRGASSPVLKKVKENIPTDVVFLLCPRVKNTAFFLRSSILFHLFNY